MTIIGDLTSVRGDWQRATAALNGDDITAAWQARVEHFQSRRPDYVECHTEGNDVTVYVPYEFDGMVLEYLSTLFPDRHLYVEQEYGFITYTLQLPTLDRPAGVFTPFTLPLLH